MLVADGRRVVALQAGSADEVLGANTIAEMMHLDQAIRAAAARPPDGRRASPSSVPTPASSTPKSRSARTPSSSLTSNCSAPPASAPTAASAPTPSSRIPSSAMASPCATAASSTARRSATARCIGPYAHLRPESHIGEQAHVGNFCETKKATLGRGSKANHLTYLGDAIIGDGVNVGAGVITCNYDGVHKHTTTIGDGVFVGSDSTLVAPISIGEGAYVGAGSCITHPVPADALAIGRSHQVTKEGWAASRPRRAAAQEILQTGRYLRMK